MGDPAKVMAGTVARMSRKVNLPFLFRRDVKRNRPAGEIVPGGTNLTQKHYGPLLHRNHAVAVC